MAENVKGQNPEPGRNDADQLRREAGRSGAASERSTAVRLDEKSSGKARRNKSRGLSSKDGVTGSDLDGQVTD